MSQLVFFFRPDSFIESGSHLCGFSRFLWVTEPFNLPYMRENTAPMDVSIDHVKVTCIQAAESDDKVTTEVEPSAGSFLFFVSLNQTEQNTRTHLVRGIFRRKVMKT